MPAPEEYRRRIHESLQNLNGIQDIVDDILCVGEGNTYESRTLSALLERCREKNVKLNPKKLQLRKQDVPYIDHLLTPDGLKPDPNKVKAILKMPTPADEQSLQRLLGISAYLRKFLTHLLDTDVEWHRADEHETALNHVKQLITREPVLRYFKHLRHSEKTVRRIMRR